MIEYRVDLSEVGSFPEFVSAMNAGMISCIGGSWNGNWDAFNDYLSWPDEETYRLVLIGWDLAASVLDEVNLPNGCRASTVFREILAANPHVEVKYL